MAQYRLESDLDFREAMERQVKLRVFKDDHVIDNHCVIVRFDEQMVVTQSGVSDIAYHSRASCEFFASRKKI